MIKLTVVGLIGTLLYHIISYYSKFYWAYSLPKAVPNTSHLSTYLLLTNALWRDTISKSQLYR